jgi:hypothetical protein
MKTYQLDIEDNYFPELKRILNMFPPNSVKLYSQNGYEIQLDTDDLELTDEFKKAIEEGITELERGEGITYENVVQELQTKYPKLNFKK